MDLFMQVGLMLMMLTALALLLAFPSITNTENNEVVEVVDSTTLVTEGSILSIIIGALPYLFIPIVLLATGAELVKLVKRKKASKYEKTWLAKFKNIRLIDDKKLASNLLEMIHDLIKDKNDFALLELEEYLLIELDALNNIENLKNSTSETKRQDLLYIVESELKAKFKSLTSKDDLTLELDVKYFKEHSQQVDLDKVKSNRLDSNSYLRNGMLSSSQVALNNNLVHDNSNNSSNECTSSQSTSQSTDNSSSYSSCVSSSYSSDSSSSSSSDSSSF